VLVVLVLKEDDDEDEDGDGAVGDVEFCEIILGASDCDDKEIDG
jgi:hypothetical protein